MGCGMEPSCRKGGAKVGFLKSEVPIFQGKNNLNPFCLNKPSDLVYVYLQVSGSIIKCLEKLQRDFLWQGRSDKKKFHLVDWK